MALRTIPRHDPPARSAEREKLASAIAEAQETQRAADGVRHAIARAADMVSKARTRLEAAQAAVASAKEQQAYRLAAAAASGTPAALASTMKQARADEVDAQDEIDAAEAALAQLKAQLAGAEEASQLAAHRRIAAVDAVMRVVAANFFADTEQVVEELLARRAVLRFLREPDPLHQPLNFYVARERDEPFAEMRNQIQRHLLNSVGRLRDDGNGEDWRGHEKLKPWSSAREALFSDADTPLPTA
jgi:hypothetical protein